MLDHVELKLELEKTKLKLNMLTNDFQKLAAMQNITQELTLKIAVCLPILTKELKKLISHKEYIALEALILATMKVPNMSAVLASQKPQPDILDNFDIKETDE